MRRELPKVETFEIDGLGTVGAVYSNFADEIRALRKAGGRYPLSVRDAAFMRIHGGPKVGTRTCHAPIYARKSPTILAMVSPLVTNVNMADQAVEANRKDKYFVTEDTKIYDKYAKIAEQDKDKEPEKRRAIFLPEKESYLIMPDSDEARTLFKDVRKGRERPEKDEGYFTTFAPNGIKFFPVSDDFINSQKGTTITYVWFSRPDYGSGLDGGDRYLDCVSRAFGVLRKTSEAGSQKTELHYTPRQLEAQIRLVRGVRFGDYPASRLERIIGFLTGLKQ